MKGEGGKGTREEGRTWDQNLKSHKARDVAPHRGREMSIQSPPSDQRTNPEMDTSEYTKKFANDVARTGVGFETNF